MVYNCKNSAWSLESLRNMGEVTSFSFSGHETFSFRYPWLKKGFDAVRADGGVFQDEDAITILGVGKNMVRSIRHWCLAAGLIEEDRQEGEKRSSSLRPSEFGTWIFDEDGLDPYLEDPATLWLIHWQIASSIRRATTWYWTFSNFNEPEFTVDQLSSAVFKWAQTLPGKEPASVSIRRDVECFIHTYVPSRTSRSLVEETLDCPLVELGLIQANSDAKTFYFRRGPQEALPDGILLYATLQFWQAFAPNSETLSISDIARQPGSPGRLFKIDESSLIGRFERAERLTEGAISFNETAGLKQLYRRMTTVGLNPHDLLELAYGLVPVDRGGIPK
jgi:Protein of unknown function (DUF4007)